MTLFIVGALLLLAVAAWLLRGVWITAEAPSGSAPGGAAGGTGAGAGAALAVLRQQLVALDAEPASDEREAARRELQRRVLEEADAAAAVDAADAGGAGRIAGAAGRGSTSLRLAVALGLPLFAAAMYAALGNPAALALQRPDAPVPAAAAPAAAPPGAVAAAAVDADPAPAAFAAMLADLAQTLAKPSADPAADAQGLAMLGRGYASLQRFAEADNALARAVVLSPDDAQLLADRADILAVLQGQRTAGEPERLIARALQIDPKNIKALALAGTAAWQRQDTAAARSHWQRASALAPPGSAFKAGLDRNLADIDDKARATPAATNGAGNSATNGSAPAAPNGQTARIVGRVSLAPALAMRAAPGDTVFVFARAAEGSRMPLAIVRATVADLPLDFVLDDRSAMSTQTPLSSSERVVVGARVSKSGDAMPQAGDLQTLTAPVPNRGSGLQLVIDEVVSR